MNMRNKIITIVLIIAIFSGFYFFYWVRRPEYALEQIVSSVIKKDTETFQRYFDIDSIYGSLFDKLASKSTVKKEEFIVKNKADALRFVDGTMTKEESEFSVCLREAMETNSLKEEQFKLIQEENGTYVAEILYVNLLHRWVCPIRIRMGQADDGRWKVIEILDFRLMRD